MISKNELILEVKVLVFYILLTIKNCELFYGI